MEFSTPAEAKKALEADIPVLNDRFTEVQACSARTEAGAPEPAPEQEEPEPAPAAPPAQEMTAQQLRDAIEAKGGFAPKKANKAQLAELLGAL